MPAEFEKGAKVERWERNLERPEAALRQVGALMVAESQRAFRDQKLGDAPWEPRAPVNVFGIVADFHAGKKSPPQRRFESRPALRDTGRLAQSVAFKLVGQDVVEVGSNLPYAGTLHKGGEVESKPITDQVRQALGRWLKGAGSKHRARLGWILNRKFAGKQLKQKVPARPIVGITKQTLADVKEAVGVRIMETTR